MPRPSTSALPVLLTIAAFVFLLALAWAFPAIRDVLNLSLPFFGLIGLGFISGRIMDIPEEGLRWMNFFIVYLALPALFFNLISAAPIEQLSNWSFIGATTFSTYCVFTLAFCYAMIAGRGEIRSATIAGIAGSYSNIGYMGPGLALAALGPLSTVPAALIIACDSTLFFMLAPLFIALASEGNTNWRETCATIL